MYHAPSSLPHSQQQTLLFLYLFTDVTLSPVYYAREIKYCYSAVLLLISEHRLEEDERPARGCVQSVRFILYGIPNHAVINMPAVVYQQ
jgi:hypothetical protein